MSSYNNIYVINPAKVASASFYHGLKKKYNKVYHGHNLSMLKNKLDNEKNNLFICGIRDPVSRNESYFFQTKNDKFHNDFKIKQNEYMGEYCYNNETNLIEAFNNRKNKFSYLDWLQEFLEITLIDSFNKRCGYSVYNLNNNNKLLVYTFEKLKINKKVFENLLDFEIENRNINSSDEYKQFKKTIIYDKQYLDRLLYNDLITFFYQKKDIDLFYIHALENNKVSKR